MSMKEHMENSLLECTMQDLLRYDDYNNDGHLSLHEFYTAFREFQVCVFPDAPYREAEPASFQVCSRTGPSATEKYLIAL